MIAAAQAPGEVSARDLLRVLQAPLDMKDFQQPMTLKEALGLFYEKTADSGLLGRGVGLPALVNQQAFRDIAPEAGDIYETPVKFPPYPRRMPMAVALQIALSQVQSGEATFLIKRGALELVPVKRATLDILVKQRVLGNFEGKYLSSAIEELAEATGVSIQVDKRLLDKANVQVTGIFRNDVSLRDALIVLTESAGVKLVELPTALFVTTPEHAAALREELSRPKTMPPAKPQTSGTSDK
ncbi:MAG: hypothetical protein L0Y71_22390 [Gemmataceae bacterium]|nr:hypothetical protein [Gemmataceae bacterium]